MFEPTQAQIDRYQRDGFLIVERFLSDEQVQRARERFMRVFEHQWETGLSPDEVNFTPGVTAPELTRQLCNVWKADRTLAGVVLSSRWAVSPHGWPACPACAWLRTTRSGSRPRARRCSAAGRRLP